MRRHIGINFHILEETTDFCLLPHSPSPGKAFKVPAIPLFPPPLSPFSGRTKSPKTKKTPFFYSILREIPFWMVSGTRHRCIFGRRSPPPSRRCTLLRGVCRVRMDMTTSICSISPATGALLTVSANLIAATARDSVRHPSRPSYFLKRPEPNQPGPVKLIFHDLFHVLPLFRITLKIQFIIKLNRKCYRTLNRFSNSINLVDPNLNRKNIL